MTHAAYCCSIKDTTKAPRSLDRGPAARPASAFALSYVRSMLFSLRAGLPGKEGRYGQRADHQHAVRLAQLSTTGHSPARDIVNLGVAQQQLNRAEVSRAAIDDRRLCAPERVG